MIPLAALVWGGVQAPPLVIFKVARFREEKPVLEQHKKMVQLCERLRDLQRQASAIYVDALSLQSTGSVKANLDARLARNLADQTTHLIMAAFKSVGLTPEVPNGFTSEELSAAFIQAVAKLAASTLPSASPSAGHRSADSMKEIALALVAESEELLGLARQAMVRANFYMQRARNSAPVQTAPPAKSASNDGAADDHWGEPRCIK